MTFLQDYALVPVILVGLTSLVLLFYPNWRWTLLAVGVQYLAVAWLVGLSWPAGLAAIKLVVGWMAGAVLSTVQAAADVPSEALSGRLFRLLVAALLLVVIFTLPPATRAWLQVSQPVFWGGMVLAGMGLLQVSMTSKPLRVVLGLLTFLAGFEVLYAALEFSVLVAGLMAATNLGLALAGTYLLSTPEHKEAGISSALIWIILPFLVSITLLPFRHRPGLVLGAAAGTSFLLAALALILPVGPAVHLGPLTLQVSPSMVIFGRRFVLQAADSSFLVLIYVFGGIWFLGSRQAGAPAFFPGIGLALVAMLVAAQAVEPFLYAALILKMAVLISLPFLSPPGERAGPGTLRFLIFQTLAVPFILLAGWASGLVEANLPGTRWVVQAIVFLGLGFAFWLAVFPFYTWIPLLAQETAPYIFGFLLGMLPVGVLWIALGFLDSFAWLRSSSAVVEGLRLTGGLMVLTAGIWAAFQTNLARMLGYAILLENGFALLAISLNSSLGLDLLAASLVPRLVGIALWSFALAIYRKHGITADLNGLVGVIRRYPMASTGLVLAYFSVGGLPLLASFPVRQPLLEALAGLSQPVAVAAVVGNLGFLVGGYRLLSAMVRSEEKEWQINEGGIEAAMLAAAVGLLILAGVFPWVILRGSLGLVQVFTNLR